MIYRADHRDFEIARLKWRQIPKPPNTFEEPSMSIYTKTGDKGTSALYSGERRDKSDRIFYALGAVDELSAQLGVAQVHCQNDGNKDLVPIISEIQSRLIDIMSNIATPSESSSEKKLSRTEFPAEEATKLEALIDSYDTQLPKLTKFILPSGGLASTQLHVARAVCRRAEREVISLWRDSIDDHAAVLCYMNRLSDLLFMMARMACFFVEKEEFTYQKGKGIEKSKKQDTSKSTPSTQDDDDDDDDDE